ncbi:MAG: RNA polymerase factor sigma-54 [Planctomycetota bacterium]
MRLELVPKLQQTQKLAPQIIQSIEILQLPTLALQELIQQEMEENPVLEMIEPVLPVEDKRSELLEEKKESAEKESFEHLDEFENYEPEEVENLYDIESSSYRTTHTIDSEKDKKLEAMQNTAAKPISLQDHLYSQVCLMELTEDKLELCLNIIYNINNSGYLPEGCSLQEILTSINNPKFTLEMAEDALEIIHNLEPSGVGGRNLRECLLLQLDSDHPDFHFLKYLIENHLDDITHNRLPKIVKDTGKNLDIVKYYLDSLSRLNPSPGDIFSQNSTHYVTPDVRVDYIEGEYVVRLEDGFIPDLTISTTYQNMLKKLKDKPQARSFLKKKIDSARWLIDSITQRQNTLFRVASKIVEYQKEFLDHGISRLKPLKMQTIANELGIHVSTVSRTINNKYIQTPRGIYPMKFFFSGATPSTSGEDESRSSVRQRVKEIIEQENKANPLSDEEVAEKLQLNGLDVARRTVTKYRKALKIPSSRQRKTY